MKYTLAAIVIILAMVVLFWVAPAYAQSMCMPYAKFVKTLNDKFGETSQGKGLAGETVIIELFASPKTFTILATTTAGDACIIAAGKGWEPSLPKIQGDEL